MSRSRAVAMCAAHCLSLCVVSEYSPHFLAARFHAIVGSDKDSVGRVFHGRSLLFPLRLNESPKLDLRPLSVSAVGDTGDTDKG